MLRSLALIGVAFLGLSTAAPSGSFGSLVKRDPPPPTGGCVDKSAPPKGWIQLPEPFPYARSYACSTAWGLTFSPVTEIITYMTHDGDHISGFTIKYASGQSDLRGEVSSADGAPPQKPLGLSIKNLITKITLRYTAGWYAAQNDGGWLLAVKFYFADGTFQLIGRQDENQGDWIIDMPLNDGGNLLMGMNTAVNQEGPNQAVADAQFLFMQGAPQHVDIGYVHYNTPSPTFGISNTGDDSNSNTNGLFVNNLQDPEYFEFEVSNTYGSENVYSQESDSMFGTDFSLGINADIMKIGVDASVGFTWSTGTTQATAISSSTSAAITCRVTGTVPAGSAVAITGQIGVATALIPYDSMVTVSCADGAVYSYSETGTMTKADSTDCTVSANFVDPNSAPSFQTTTGFVTTKPVTDAQTSTTSSSVASSTTSTDLQTTSMSITSTASPSSTASATSSSSDDFSSESSTDSSADSSTVAASSGTSTISPGTSAGPYGMNNGTATTGSTGATISGMATGMAQARNLHIKKF